MNRQRLLVQITRLGWIVVLLTGCSARSVQTMATPTPIPPTPMVRLDGQRALLVIYEHFQQREYDIPRAILEELGCVVTVASSSLDVLTGTGGAKVRADLLLSEVHAADYDAIVFVGGTQYGINDPEAQRIAQEAMVRDKVVAAICIAPITLAKAGLLQGKRVTAALNPAVLEEYGAIHSGAGVERDGFIITADSPGSSREFGETIAAAMGE
jgi:protease I